jgi:hypothetical protein
MPLTVECDGHWYKRMEEGGKWYYVDDGPVPVTCAAVRRAFGGSPFWTRLFPELIPLPPSL